MARGWRAMTPDDPGFAYAFENQINKIESEVVLLTNTKGPKPGQYHCITRYLLGGRWFRDDPSARLGMPLPMDGLAMSQGRPA